MTTTSSERSLTNFRGVEDPTVRVTKPSFIAFDTPDVDRLATYYSEALGLALVERTDSHAYLTTGSDHHCVVIAQGEASAPARIGFEIEGRLEDARAHLERDGIAYEQQTDPDPGVDACLVIHDPDGRQLILCEGQSPSGETSVPGIRPTKLGHVALHVADLATTQVFYEDVLGFRWSDTMGDYFAFMRCGPDHHSMNFLARPDESDRAGGLHHVAYEMRDLGQLRDALDHISKHGYTLEWGLGRHGAGHNLFSYHRDPDGNLTELFTELDVIHDETTGYFEPRPWHETNPQGPRVWVPGPGSANRWGPMP